MKRVARLWAPVLVLWGGAVMTSGILPQLRPELRGPLADAVPREMEGYAAEERTVSEAEERIAGFSDYLLRTYSRPGGEPDAPDRFSVYVAYYESQAQGQTVHSPRNCLPGAGWEALESRTLSIDGPYGPVTVNRYIVQNDEQRALVLYWYQGRGRIEADEFAVKWDLLRDAAVKRRSDEALVRIVVPVEDSQRAALELARRVAEPISRSLVDVLPS